MIQKMLITTIAAIFVIAMTAQSQTAATEDLSTFYDRLAKDYCSNVTTIFANTHLPPERFCNADDVGTRLKHFPTIVHEDYHSFNHHINGDHHAEAASERLFWLNDSISIRVPKFEVFNSRVISAYIPYEMREKVPSYNTYLLDSYQYEHDAQRNGIFGIMEEFAAYYQGAKAYIELFEYYQDSCPLEEGEMWAYYLINASDIYAYYEFQLFISWYLQIAKQKHPEVYENIMASQELRVLYTLIDLQYIKVINTYFKNRKEVMEELAANEVGISIKHNYLWIDKKLTNTSSVGYDLPENTMKILIDLLKKPEHDVLAELYMEGMTLENYKQFLPPSTVVNADK